MRQNAPGKLSSFSALQRAEIAEMIPHTSKPSRCIGFSALQRAEIAEIDWVERCVLYRTGFSALQRAEIAEMVTYSETQRSLTSRFSALQRAEIAEIRYLYDRYKRERMFQCSSTSRNC